MFEFFLPNSDHCFHEDVRAKLFVWSRLTWGKISISCMCNALSTSSGLAVWKILVSVVLIKREKTIYYANTSEIPSELSRVNFLSWHVRITCYLHTWRDHCRHGYIINRTFESKLIWYFTGVYIINCWAHSWDIKLTTRR